MTLGEKQRLFTQFIGQLIEWAYSEGYMLTFGDAYRDARVFGKMGTRKGYGRSRSNHKVRLAVDFNLFKWNGSRWIYQTSTEAHRPLAEYWESLHGLCAAGYRFNDGNHYSMEHMGRR